MNVSTMSTNIVPILFYLNLVLFILLAALLRKEITSKFLRIKKKTWLLLLIILILGLTLRIFAPSIHHFFVDESWYMQSARSISQSFQSKLETGTYDKPIGWPAILAIPFFILSPNNYIAILTSELIGALSIILIFLVNCLLFNEKSALYSAFLLCIFPPHIIWSSTAEIIVPSIFFMLLSYFTFFIFLDKPSSKSFLLFIFSFTLLLSFRIENIISIIPVIIYSIFLKKHIIKKYIMVSFLATPFFLSYLFQSYQLIFLYKTVHENSPAGLFGFNLLNLQLFLNIIMTPFMLIFLILVLIACIRLEGKKAMFLISGFIIYTTFYFFYLFSTDFHLLPGWIFLIILAGKSIQLFQKWKFFLIPLLLIASLLSFPPIEHESIFSLQTQIINDMDNMIPKECYLISEVPVIFSSVNEIKTISTISFLQDENLAIIPNGKNNCFYYLEDMYCKENFLRTSTDRCTRMKKNFKITTIKKFSNPDTNFTLFSLEFH